ncbi:MAG: tocopherol cyclase family protein [Lachnospiraceae bacterium]|nr:tocopherol cyclase family protein [Lachnospiraceae bacterium]
MNQFFQGYYFKHQKGAETLCVITGWSDSNRFIQIITQNGSWQTSLTKGNHFSKQGIILDIHTPELSLTGRISYHDLSPIRYDIMGPFQILPMECRHGIISMNHRLKGRVILNGKSIDFTGGKGYIEKDSGCSFPSSYAWVQANDFREDCSIMAAVAEIPVCGLTFRGCISVIHYKNREYRFATYLEVQILSCTKETIILKQGSYQLHIRIGVKNGHYLSAPKKGKMSRKIIESASCPAEYVLYKGNIQIFHLFSYHTSFEYEY